MPQLEAHWSSVMKVLEPCVETVIGILYRREGVKYYILHNSCQHNVFEIICIQTIEMGGRTQKSSQDLNQGRLNAGQTLTIELLELWHWSRG